MIGDIDKELEENSGGKSETNLRKGKTAVQILKGEARKM